jgi:charged multivesicular body protein 7
LALIANKVGDKQIALRHVRYLKIGLDGKAKCTGFMDKVEEVLGMISNAESTKKVSEAIQLGAQLIKEHGIGVEEVHACF